MTILGASILVLIPSQITPVPGLQTKMSPALIPALAAIGLIASGIGLILQSAVKGGTAVAVDFDRTRMVRIVSSVFLLIAYTVIFPRLGFVVTSTVFMAFFSWYFGGRDLVKIVLVSVLSPLVVWLFFEKLFLIPLPHGVLY